MPKLVLFDNIIACIRSWLLPQALSKCQQLEACPDVLLPEGTLTHISREVDGAFGMREGPPPKPLAWRGAGHAHQAATLQLALLQRSLENLCSFGCLGYSPALTHQSLQDGSVDSRIWALMRRAWAAEDASCVLDQDEEMTEACLRCDEH